MQILLLVAVLNQTQTATLPPVRDPVFSADGRLAVSFEGDLWLRDTGGRRWTRLTSGPAWDRQPAWSADGQSLTFVSDREGGSHLFRVAIRGGAPERLTNDALPDAEPTVGRDGSVAFVRGRGASARLWVRSANGAELRLTRGEVQERWPVASPDGQRIAYVQFVDGARRLRIRPFAAAESPARGGAAGGGRAGRGSAAIDPDSIVVADRAPERPTWSPDGKRLAFYSATPRAGIYVAPTGGTYVNAVILRRGVPSWAPDGRTILIAERGSDEPGYNGDPDRSIDRSATESFSPSTQPLVVVQSPVAPDERPVTAPVGASIDRAARNAEAFDRYWARMDRVYYAGADAGERRTRWNSLKASFRTRALAAEDDQALERVLHELSRARPPLRPDASGRAAVSSAHPVATEAGLEIFRKGGNAVDAAVAVSFALGVVEPDASGVGGYGEMLIQVPGLERPALIEFMARVPEEATLSNAASLMENGRYPSDGPLLAMVPGTVSGIHTAWTRYGSRKVPWADLIAPAIRAAKNGYVVSEGLATTLLRERDSFAKYESSRALFFRDGKPRIAGDTILNPDLAWTLEQIARAGADGFYRGAVAERLVSDLRGKGSAMRLTDLSRYFAADREPVTTTYRGTTVFSAAPPVSGGTTLVAQLNLLEQFPQPRLYTDDAATLHAMVTAWQLVPSGRGRTGDPSLWPVNTDVFSNKDTARVRWKCYDPGQLLAPGAVNNVAACDTARRATSPGPEFASSEDECLGQPHAAGAVCRANGTTAFAVADADGNVVSVTQTLGTWGGNFYVSPGLGFLYNDKLTSYGTDPNAYGARIPFARHGSTLAPTIVFRGNGSARRPILAVGAAGNQWITSAVYQTLVGVVDFGLGPQQALELPRFIPSGRGAGAGDGSTTPLRRQLTVDIEDGFSPDVMRQLQAMGYEFNRISVRGELRMGYGAAVAIGDSVVTAGADPRRSGAAGAVR